MNYAAFLSAALAACTVVQEQSPAQAADTGFQWKPEQLARLQALHADAKDTGWRIVLFVQSDTHKHEIVDLNTGAPTTCTELDVCKTLAEAGYLVARH